VKVQKGLALQSRDAQNALLGLLRENLAGQASANAAWCLWLVNGA
jgi:hypothetical protein